MQDIAALVSEIEAAVQALPSGADQPVSAADLAGLGEQQFVGWRQTVSSQAEGDLRDRVMWALLGAERHVRAMRSAGAGDQASAARLRLEAAVRALREMLPILERPPSPT